MTHDQRQRLQAAIEHVQQQIASLTEEMYNLSRRQGKFRRNPDAHLAQCTKLFCRVADLEDWLKRANAAGRR